MKKVLLALLVVGAIGIAPYALASPVPISPGGSVVFSGSTGQDGSTFPVPGLTLVANTGVVTLTDLPGSNVNATGQEEVFSTATGTLDFFIKIVNNQSGGTDNLALVDVRNFTGFTTALGYVLAPSTGVAPSSANVTTGGDTVNFVFLNSSMQNTLGSLSPGGLCASNPCPSEWLEIDTNATNFAETGFVGVQDGGNAGMLAFSPTAVPEPKAIGLVGGLALLCVALWRRRSQSLRSI
jgi:hypothetical protein